MPKCHFGHLAEVQGTEAESSCVVFRREAKNQVLGGESPAARNRGTNRWCQVVTGSPTLLWLKLEEESPKLWQMSL